MTRRSGNPIYHDEPEWYERAGEIVELHVQQQPTIMAAPALPYRTYAPDQAPSTEAKAFPWASRAGMLDVERKALDAGQIRTIDKDHPRWAEALAAYQAGHDAWSAWLRDNAADL